MVLGIYGASGLGTEYEYAATIIQDRTPRWEDIVFIDDTPEKMGTTLVNRTIMGFEQAIEKYGMDGIEFIVAIGEPAVREIVFNKIDARGVRFTNLIHPDIKINESFSCGKGILIHGGNCTPPCSNFGNNILVQGTAIMGHHLTVGDNVVISSLAFVPGNVTIGKNAYIGPSCCIRNGLTIGENAIIGMGAVVTKDVPANAVVYGNPARIMRYNENGRVFSK